MTANPAATPNLALATISPNAYDLRAAELPARAVGIGWAVYCELVLIAALLAAIGSCVTMAYSAEHDDLRVLRFAAIANGSLLGCALLTTFYFSSFPI